MSDKSDMKRQPGLDQLISLKGQHALMTGSAAGIGKAIAHRFAEAGASLSLVDIDGDNVAVTERELVGLGAQGQSLCSRCVGQERNRWIVGESERT